MTDKEKYDIVLEMTSRWCEGASFSYDVIASELGIDYFDFDSAEEFDDAAWKALINAIKPNYNRYNILLTARAMEDYGNRVDVLYGEELKVFAGMILDSLGEERKL